MASALWNWTDFRRLLIMSLFGHKNRFRWGKSIHQGVRRLWLWLSFWPCEIIRGVQQLWLWLSLVHVRSPLPSRISPNRILYYKTDVFRWRSHLRFRNCLGHLQPSVSQNLVDVFYRKNVICRIRKWLDLVLQRTSPVAEQTYRMNQSQASRARSHASLVPHLAVVLKGVGQAEVTNDKVAGSRIILSCQENALWLEIIVQHPCSAIAVLAHLICYKDGSAANCLWDTWRTNLCRK